MVAANRFHFGFWAAGSAVLGVVLSGPLALLVVNATHPQPAWQGAATFASHYHPIQLLPFAGGLVLVGGLIALVTSAHAIAPPELRIRAALAQVFASVFAAFIFFNYVVQTTYVPALARSTDAGQAAALATFTMTNPTSLGWAVEMWGYAFLGVATWLIAPVFGGDRLERATAWTLVANGPVSIAGGLWTALQPGWVTTSAGLVAFAGWNLLVAVMATLAGLAFRRRSRTADGVPRAQDVRKLADVARVVHP